ncbi:MAG: hypothetical protein F6K30_25055, partial [Cyanothece sp. SIO2G6]|nr:hypothetical protein [Cyanothece sp. SIO2G6]
TLVFDYPTITEMVERVMALLFPDTEAAASESSSNQSDRPAFASTIVPIQPHGSRPPYFFVSGILGTVLDLQPLSQALDSEQPFYGLRSLGLDEAIPPYTTMEAIAAYHIHALQAVQSTGPYHLGGYSFGGKVAFEMAQQLQKQGARVASLTLIDIQRQVPAIEQTADQWSDIQYITELAKFYQGLVDQPLVLSPDDFSKAHDPLQVLQTALQTAGQTMTTLDLQRALAVYKANTQASAAYRPQPLKGIPVTLIRAETVGALGDYLPNAAQTDHDPTWGWQPLVDTLTVKTVPGNHFTLLRFPHVWTLAQTFSDTLHGQDLPSE